MNRRTALFIALLVVSSATGWFYVASQTKEKGTYLPDSSLFPTSVGGWRIDWMRKDFDVSFFDGDDQYFSSIVHSPDVPKEYLENLKSEIILEEKIINGHTRIVEIQHYPAASNRNGPPVNGLETVYVSDPEYILQVIRFKKGSGIPSESWFPCAIINDQFKILAYKPKSEQDEDGNG
jgi:hypothetical protein